MHELKKITKNNKISILYIKLLKSYTQNKLQSYTQNKVQSYTRIQKFINNSNGKKKLHLKIKLGKELLY